MQKTDSTEEFRLLQADLEKYSAWCYAHPEKLA